MAIMGILVYAGATVLGNHRGAAVRSLLDELESAVVDAQRYAINSGRDVALVSWGTTDVMTTLGLARGDAALSATNIKAIQDGMVATPQVASTLNLANSVAPLVTSISRDYLAPIDGSKPKLGYFMNLPAASNGLVPKGINPPIVVVGSLF